MDSSSRRRSHPAEVAVAVCCFTMVGQTAAFSQDRGASPVPPSTPTAVRFGTLTPGGATSSIPVQPNAEPPVHSASVRSAANTHGFPMIEGQEVQPIDLASALRLAGARDLDIATARQQVLQALGALDQARGLWLPSLFTGLTYYRLDGQVREINGQVINVSRCSLELSSTASLANSFPAPPPGSGFPPLNSLSGTLRISDAIYGVQVAKRTIAANKAGVAVATNDALLAVANAYFGLQQAAGTLAIAREAAGNALILEGITGTFERSGAGLEADHRRILTELRSRRSSIRLATGQREVAAANLVRPLLLDLHIVVAPVEPAESVIRLVADDIPLDDLIAQGWRCPACSRKRPASASITCATSSTPRDGLSEAAPLGATCPRISPLGDGRSVGRCGSAAWRRIMSG